MDAIQDVRDEIAAGLTLAGWNAYSSTPGHAELPAVVVGLPVSIDPTLTVGYWDLELPVYFVVPATEPASSESSLLGALGPLVTALKALEGSWAGRLRVVGIDSFFDVTVGNTSALSAVATVALMIPSPS